MGNKWKVGIIVSLIFVLGYLAGMGTLISLWYFKMSSFTYMGSPTKIMNRLNKTLNLTQEQKVIVEKTVRQTRKDLLKLRDEIKPKIKNRLERSQNDISTILNEEQRRIFDQFVEKRLKWFKKMQEKMARLRESD